MAEIILRGKAGPVTVKREGKAVITKKTVADATIEERTVATRVTGKQAAHATHTHAELQTIVKEVEAKAAKKIDAAKKQAKQKVEHMTNKLISAKEAGKANTNKVKGELKESKEELRKFLERKAAKRDKKTERKRATLDMEQPTPT
jgi:hypothetical protein